LRAFSLLLQGTKRKRSEADGEAFLSENSGIIINFMYRRARARARAHAQPRAARRPSTMIHFTLCIPAFALLTKVETSFVGRDLISPVSLPTSPSLHPPTPPLFWLPSLSIPTAKNVVHIRLRYGETSRIARVFTRMRCAITLWKLQVFRILPQRSPPPPPA